jgi:pimeloyl-ACP methyl ester carboxylesterase
MSAVIPQENAGNMGLRLPSMHMLWSKLRVNIFMLSYRGYGRSEGEPDEVGLMQDADAVSSRRPPLCAEVSGHEASSVWSLELVSKRTDSAIVPLAVISALSQAILHVASRSDVDARRILVHGRSLGGAVGCFVAEKYPEMVKGLVLENTFTSIADMVDVVLPVRILRHRSRMQRSWRLICRNCVLTRRESSPCSGLRPSKTSSCGLGGDRLSVSRQSPPPSSSFQVNC